MDFEYEDQGFIINSDVLAEWGLKKIKEEQAEHDRLVELAQAEIKSLTDKIAALDQTFESRTGFLKSKLYEYFQTVEHKSTKTQESYKLLSGSLVWKKPTVKLKRPDDDRLVEIMKSVGADEFVEVIQKPKWSEFKKSLTVMGDNVVDQYGSVVDGLEFEEEPGKFDVSKEDI